MGTQGTPIWIGGIWESLSLNSSINLARLDYAVPEQVKKFLQYFQDMIKVIVKVQSLSILESEAIVYVDHFQEGNVYEVNNLYETSFPKLTDQYFKVRTTIKDFDGIQGVWNSESNLSFDLA